MLVQPRNWALKNVKNDGLDTVASVSLHLQLDRDVPDTANGARKAARRPAFVTIRRAHCEIWSR